ncbi:MAG TPA: glycogen debranching N-terminal domain-containing protein [Roseiarcus sp.]
MADRPLSIDIRHPLILKANDLFLLTREDGEIIAGVPGFGLFYRDTCYLAAYALRLHGTAPLLLMSSDTEGLSAQIALTNDHLATANGQIIADHKLSIRRTLATLDEPEPTFTDTISIRNFGTEAITLPVSLEFSTTFESMFVLRGAPPGVRGRMHAPEWDETALRFAYEGADGVLRTLLADFSLKPIVAPRTTEQSIAHFELQLEPQGTEDLVVTCRVDERPVGDAPPVSRRAPISADAMRQAKEAASKALLKDYARVETSSKAFGEALARSLTDLALLEVRRGPHRFTAAGVPWFVGLFGRDSLLPTIQCLAFNPALGRRTTEALARWQGEKDDARTGEQPGKILHELRVGELPHLHEVSQTPSYASVDATLLFLIAIARHVTWTGEMALFDRLSPNVGRALDWLDRKTGENESGYVAYDGLAAGGQPVNQSWRDSGTGVLRGDGAYPVPPLALVEVQGYAYQARMAIAPLFRRRGETAKADRLEADARALQARFLQDFWMEAEGCYCLALEKDGRQVASTASNAAQVLWTGIATFDHACKIAARMMKPDMFSGWGVRTLSADHPLFDPLAYQQGSVWAFDNALIVSGLRRYGEDDSALRIVAATLDAADGFRLQRLPEFIGGTQRLPGDGPTHTPRADPLQAWSAAAIPFMTTELLGLDGDGFEKRLHVRRPRLPNGVDALSLHDLRAAGGQVSLRFTRQGENIGAEIIEGGKGLEVIVE